MKSMTGFGRSVIKEVDGLDGVIEITSVNRKNLDVVHSCPKDWIGLDSLLIPEVKKFIHRGRIAISIRVQLDEADPNNPWSEALLRQDLSRLREFATNENIDFAIDASLLAKIAYEQTRSTTMPEWTSLKEALIVTLKEALVGLVQMRTDEGLSLYKDLRERIQTMMNLKETISNESVGMVEQHRSKLMERLKSANLDIDIEDERVLKEVALFADRCDISEELTRLDSHYKQFLETIEADGSIGRKLEFIAQEMGRELNTIGSKGNKIEISKAVIESKNELESIREQILNVE